MEKDENFYSGEFFRKSYLYQSIYYDDLKKWFQLFPKKQILVLNVDDFNSKPQKTFDRVFNFLGLSHYNVKLIRYNSQKNPEIDPLEVKNIAQNVFPGKHVHGTLYQGGTSPIEVIFYEEKPEFYKSVFVHPWSGEILHIEDHLSGFFHFVLDGHMHLWLPAEIGSEIVAWSTFIFFLMLVSGIILWWPKNKKVRKQRTWFRWKESTKWKRKNYDLHQIIGFYASFIAVIFIFTGLIMTFDSFAAGFYKTIGGKKEVVFSG